MARPDPINQSGERSGSNRLTSDLTDAIGAHLDDESGTAPVSPRIHRPYRRYIEQLATPGGHRIAASMHLAKRTAAVAPEDVTAASAESSARISEIAQAGLKSHTTYRAEVDGLRALAILPVVLFHLDVSGFGGGYVGVDVFFVISGYLITSLIQRELDQGQFSFLRFWERRARRILPALTVVVLFSFAAGCFILIPSDLENFGRSAFAQSVFASNILFWLQSGYFDADAETKPLLHTWSLSVEEQFYFFFPFALFALSLFSRSLRVWAIAGALLVSFALSVWGVANHPNATFYLLPTRGWELLLGALIALAPSSNSVGAAVHRCDEVLSWLGVAAIAAVVFTYHMETPFPGWAALLPCIGTAAIIWANGTRLTFLGRILSTAPLVKIGLISYSLYLWHWPLIVFADYASFDELTLLDKSAIIALSFVLAWFSWKFVENPIRRRVLLRKRTHLAAAAATGLLVAGGLGLSAEFANGYPSRLPPDARRYAAGALDDNPRSKECHSIALKLVEPIEPCRLGATGSNDDPALLVWGDSHASAFMPVLDAMAAESSVPAWFASYSGCPPIQGVFSPGKKNDACPRFNRTLLRLAEEHGIQHLVLIANWSLFTEGEESGEMAWLIGDAQSNSPSSQDPRAVFEKRITETLDALLQHGFTVWIVKQVPLQRFLPSVRLTQVSLYGGDPSSVGRPLSEHVARQSFVNSVLEKIEHDRLHLLDPAPLLCAEDRVCRTARDGRSLYKDEHHLSRFGALQMRPMFEAMFRSIADRG